MRVAQIKLRHSTFSELEATVESRGLLSVRSLPLFYRFPSEFGESLTISADPFIAALLCPSMLLGEPLVVEALASPRLLQALPKIMTFYHSWNPKFKIIEVKTLGEFRPAHSTSTAQALFFTCGIDSFYALTKLTEIPLKRNLTHLILVHGFDIKLHDTSLFERTHLAMNEIASHYNMKLMIVKTNLRTVTDEYLNLDKCLGAGLASVALCLGNFFRKVYFASDLGPNETAPLAVHPDLDPLWSTETTTFVHHLPGTSRADKARLLTTNTLAQEHLRVCWENRNGAYNCGRCSKCIRTMLALHLAGGLSKFPFPTKLTPQLVEGIVDYYPDPSATAHGEHIVIELRKKGEIQLANSLSHAVRKTYLRRRLDALLLALLQNRSTRRIVRSIAKKSGHLHVL